VIVLFCLLDDKSFYTCFDHLKGVSLLNMLGKDLTHISKSEGFLWHEKCLPFLTFVSSLSVRYFNDTVTIPKETT
jgi:hypothetical protein